MLKLSLSVVALLLMTTTYSQMANEFRQQAPRMIAYGSLPEDEKRENVQRNFITQTWRLGLISFKNTSNRIEVPIIFDMYSNKLYFLKNGVIMDFNEPVKEFVIPVLVKDDTVNLLYRNSYPAIHKNTGETFYEVMVDGKFQLLRCKAKTISLYKDREVPEEERDYKKELLYAALPNGKIVLVKKDKNHLMKEMPEYAAAIEKITTDHKLKLKNEEQLKELFRALNK